MSNNDIEEQIRELYDFNVSTSTILRITDAITYVHQIRNSCRYVVWKDKKGVTLKTMGRIL